MSTLTIKELDTELQCFKRRFQFANYETTKINQVDLFRTQSQQNHIICAQVLLLCS